jgi:hypothetical protein
LPLSSIADRVISRPFIKGSRFQGSRAIAGHCEALPQAEHPHKAGKTLEGKPCFFRFQARPIPGFPGRPIPGFLLARTMTLGFARSLAPRPARFLTPRPALYPHSPLSFNRQFLTAPRSGVSGKRPDGTP